METTRESVAEDIANAITTWETYDWKDTDLWESFQDDFRGYTEDDFRLVNNNDVRRLRKFLRRRGVWIEKSRTTIARSLFNALQEEEPTQWTDADIQEYLSTEGAFDSYRINYRLKKTPIALSLGNVPPTVPPSIPPSIPAIIKPTTSVSNVSTNNLPQAPSNSQTPVIQGYGRELANLAKMYSDEAKYSTPTSLLGPPAAVTSSVPASSTSSSVSPTILGTAPVCTSSASPTPASVNASTILPSTTTFVPSPTPPTGTRSSPAVEPIINLPSAINPPAAMTTTSTSYSRELLDLAKIDTDETKHSGRNDTPTFELAKLWKNALSSLLKNFRMGSTGGRGPCQAMRWMRWMRWDSQNGMDETRVGVG